MNVANVNHPWSDRLYIRWLCTQWCSMNCPYCQQAHTRKQYYRGSPGHCFDNRTPAEWLAAFESRFSHKRCVFHLTGGEPMLDRRNAKPFLEALVSYPWVDVVHIDTNGSFEWTISDSSKVYLNLSYHPTQQSFSDFLATLERLRRDWRVLLVNVMAVEGIDLLTIRDAIRPTPLAAIPEQGAGVIPFVHPQLKELTPEADAKRGWEPTAGKLCLYPAIAYEIEPDGSLIVACHRGKLHGNLFDGPLPDLFAGYIPCPKQSCTCEERYSMLQELGVPELSPKVIYAERLIDRQLVER